MVAIFLTPRSVQTACEIFELNRRPLSERMLRGHLQRGMPADGNVSRALSCELGCSDCDLVGSAAETIIGDKNVSVTSRGDREGAEVIDADGNAGPFK